jgi:hypothetical protein
MRASRHFYTGQSVVGWVSLALHPASSLRDRSSNILIRCTRCHPAPLLSKIAAILADIDIEIATLEQRCGKIQVLVGWGER